MTQSRWYARLLALLWLCLFIVASPGPRLAVAATADAAPSKTMSLNGDWQFALAPNQAEADKMAGFYESSFDADGFRSIPVPANWAMHGFEEPVWNQHMRGRPNVTNKDVLPLPSEAEGFYLHRFQAPQDIAGKRAILHFDGVWSSAEVWLNGQRLGRHESGFTGFQFDIADHVRPGDENTLAVRVRQRTKEAQLDTNDDWALGGIFRDVRVEYMPAEMFIQRIEAETKFDPSYRDANLNLRLFFGRLLNKPQAMQVQVTLTDASATEIARAEYAGEIKACGFVVCGQEVPLSIPVQAPKQWTAETPDLYDLRVDLLMDGRVVHTRMEKIGFREVSTAGGVLTVNGHPVRLRGVGRHDEHPEVGRATRPEHWLEDIRMMKAANINAVRTTHYPPAEGFIALCDQMGLYVIDEVPLGFGGDLLHDDALAGSLLLRAHETVRRDRNHPSVIMWSIGNEDPLTDLHLAAIRYVKATDPTRPVLMPWNADETLPPEIDILAPHYKTAEEYDRLTATARRPLITTEYTHALGAHDFGGLEDRWQAITRHPAGAGGMIWLWRDQGILRKPNGRTVLNPLSDLGKYKAVGTELVRHSSAGGDAIYDAHGVFGMDGIVDPDGTPQRDYWETKAVYAPVRVMTERLAYQAGQPSATIAIRNDFDFTDLSTVRVAWEVMRDDLALKSGEARLKAPPRTTTFLEVPLDAITDIATAAHYVRLTIQRDDGSEITKRSVRLVPDLSAVAARGIESDRSAPTGQAQVLQSGAQVTVTAGKAAYDFDPQTAQLTGMTLNGEALTTGARATIWRPLTISELRQFRKGDEKEEPLAPELDQYQTTVRKWNVNQYAEGVRIEAEADHRIDDKNGFSARYDYLIEPSGAVQVRYAIKPQVEFEWLPEVGIRFDTSNLDAMRWAGHGPLDSSPNKKEATPFGVWSARTGTPEMEGSKSGVEWAELNTAAGNGIRISGAPFIRLETASSGSRTLRVLSAMAGNSTKFKRPERPEDRLDLSPGREFVGEFTISPRILADD